MNTISDVYPSTTTSSGGVSSQGTKLGSDFETFLKMLTTQAQNQDPLNPLDSAEYASQLASFSSVEQQVLTNDLLTQLNGQFSASDLSQLTDWVGSEVLSDSAAYFEGQNVMLQLPNRTSAEQSILVVRDADGSEVRRQQISSGQSSVVWDGYTNAGSTAQTGFYSFQVESYEAGVLSSTANAQPYHRVIEARTSGDNQIALTLLGGAEVNSSSVSGIRVMEPDGVN